MLICTDASTFLTTAVGMCFNAKISAHTSCCNSERCLVCGCLEWLQWCKWQTDIMKDILNLVCKTWPPLPCSYLHILSSSLVISAVSLITCLIRHLMNRMWNVFAWKCELNVLFNFGFDIKKKVTKHILRWRTSVHDSLCPYLKLITWLIYAIIYGKFQCWAFFGIEKLK